MYCCFGVREGGEIWTGAKIGAELARSPVRRSRIICHRWKGAGKGGFCRFLFPVDSSTGGDYLALRGPHRIDYMWVLESGAWRHTMHNNKLDKMGR